MTSFLVANIGGYGRDIALANADNTISSLPFEHLISTCSANLGVPFGGGARFEFADAVADRNAGIPLHQRMRVVPRGVRDEQAQVEGVADFGHAGVDEYFDLGRQDMLALS